MRNYEAVSSSHNGSCSIAFIVERRVSASWGVCKIKPFSRFVFTILAIASGEAGMPLFQAGLSLLRPLFQGICPFRPFVRQFVILEEDIFLQTQQRLHLLISQVVCYISGTKALETCQFDDRDQLQVSFYQTDFCQFRASHIWHRVPFVAHRHDHSPSEKTPRFSSLLFFVYGSYTLWTGMYYHMLCNLIACHHNVNGYCRMLLGAWFACKHDKTSFEGIHYWYLTWMVLSSVLVASGYTRNILTGDKVPDCNHRSGTTLFSPLYHSSASKARLEAAL